MSDMKLTRRILQGGAYTMLAPRLGNRKWSVHMLTSTACILTRVRVFFTTVLISVFSVLVMSCGAQSAAMEVRRTGCLTQLLKHSRCMLQHCII